MIDPAQNPVRVWDKVKQPEAGAVGGRTVDCEPLFTAGFNPHAFFQVTAWLTPDCGRAGATTTGSPRGRTAVTSASSPASSMPSSLVRRNFMEGEIERPSFEAQGPTSKSSPLNEIQARWRDVQSGLRPATSRPCVEEQATAGHARFSFLQLGNVNHPDFTPSLLQYCFRPGRSCGQDHRFLDQKRVCGGELCLGNIEQIKPAESIRIDLGSMHENRVVADV